MKKWILGCLYCFSFLPGLQAAQPRASFEKIWVDYNETVDGMKGMRIHLKFTAYEMKDMEAFVAIYFEYNDEMAGYLKDRNKKFYSAAGEVAIYQNIKPAFDPAVYNDLQLFMPYSELDLEPGIYDLSMDIKLIYKEGGVLQRLTHHNFEYKKPGSPADKESPYQANAALDNMWVDYDVMEAGKKGMRIHAKFTTFNLKNVDCYLAVYFQRVNGDKLPGTDNYSSKNGQLALYKSIKPAYDEAVYNDLQMFLPYSEIRVGKGRFDLVMDARIIFKNGDVIKNLKNINFWFEQK